MLKALIISEKDFLHQALVSYSAYDGVISFVNYVSYIDGYDVYISDFSIEKENVIIAKSSDGMIDIAEVISCIDQIVHRSNNVVEYKDLKLEIASKTLIFEGDSLDLTSVETSILKTLIMHHKEGATRDYLLNNILGYTNDTETKALENHIYKLRKKLESLTLKIAISKTDDGYKIV